MKQTHTTVVRYPDDEKHFGDCMLCGSSIEWGEPCEQTTVDGDTTYCCRECTEGDCPEEYAAINCDNRFKD